MSDHSRPRREELNEALALVIEEATDYLGGLDERALVAPDPDEALRAFDTALPESGEGATAALRQLIADGLPGSVATSGPRCFHFVIGGATPAALAADWLATATDQIAYAWVTSPLGVKLEQVCLNWLTELFDLPRDWGGLMTTGATMANYVCLAGARQWWGARHGVDVSEDGMSGLPPVPVLTSGFVHASTLKALSMLGIGRGAARRFSRDAAGRIDLDAMAEALRELDGQPAILVGNAGEVTAGEFDPIDALADLAEEHGAWLHVDGAFGLFARVSPRTRALAAGVERAQSVTVDGHKWLNVPYDCGFAFVNDVTLLAKAFTYSAAYLPKPDDPRPNMGAIGPESSRRARSLAVWATLRAYGRSGVQAIVEQHLDLARHLARLVDAAPDLERLAEVPLNIVCFRYNPGGLDEEALNRLNHEIGERVLADGRVYVGTTAFEGKTAFRPALSNWRTRESDVALLVQVIRELAGGRTRR